LGRSKRGASYEAEELLIVGPSLERAADRIGGLAGALVAGTGAAGVPARADTGSCGSSDVGTAGAEKTLPCLNANAMTPECRHTRLNEATREQHGVEQSSYSSAAAGGSGSAEASPRAPGEARFYRHDVVKISGQCALRHGAERPRV
jgi:hypothetical protein